MPGFRINRDRMIRLLAVFLVLAGLVAAGAAGPSQATRGACDLHEFNKTSARLMYDYSLCRLEAASPSAREALQGRHLLVADIYVKARSYAFLNKFFFILSVVGALMVLLWPSVGVIFKARIEKNARWSWMHSAVVQTTITGLAALMFAFYSQYKDKQTSAESLLRHVVHTREAPDRLAVFVAAELARIDRGFSFSAALDSTEGAP